MSVNRMIQLHLYLLQTVQKNAPLFFRQMKGFVRTVGEERIMFDFLSQRCSFYQVGMEQQATGIQGCSLLQRCFDNLPRRKAGHRAFLIVVSLPAIADISTTGLFQKQGIHAVVQDKMFGMTRSLRQVDHTDKRMQCFQSEQIVVLLYILQFNYIFHNRYVFTFPQM